MSALLRLDSVEVGYRDLVAVRDVSLDVRAGEVVAEGDAEHEAERDGERAGLREALEPLSELALHRAAQMEEAPRELADARTSLAIECRDGLSGALQGVKRQLDDIRLGGVKVALVRQGGQLQDAGWVCVTLRDRVVDAPRSPARRISATDSSP
jgi:hypothetical protein